MYKMKVHSEKSKMITKFYIIKNVRQETFYFNLFLI